MIRIHTGSESKEERGRPDTRSIGDLQNPDLGVAGQNLTTMRVNRERKYMESHGQLVEVLRISRSFFAKPEVHRSLELTRAITYAPMGHRALRCPVRMEKSNGRVIKTARSW